MKAFYYDEDSDCQKTYDRLVRFFGSTKEEDWVLRGTRVCVENKIEFIVGENQYSDNFTHRWRNGGLATETTSPLLAKDVWTVTLDDHYESSETRSFSSKELALACAEYQTASDRRSDKYPWTKEGDLRWTCVDRTISVSKLEMDDDMFFGDDDDQYVALV